jgi:hypothetical protein
MRNLFSLLPSCIYHSISTSYMHSLIFLYTHMALFILNNMILVTSNISRRVKKQYYTSEQSSIVYVIGFIASAAIKVCLSVKIIRLLSPSMIASIKPKSYSNCPIFISNTMAGLHFTPRKYIFTSAVVCNLSFI